MSLSFPHFPNEETETQKYSLVFFQIHKVEKVDKPGFETR